MSESNNLELKHVVFVGRTWEDYVQMFSLQEADLPGRKILDCPGGAASFARTAGERGVDVTATDIAYHFTPDELLGKGLSDLETLQQLMQKNPEVLKHAEQNKRFASLLSDMTQTLHETIADIRQQGYGTRYVPGRLPELPFADREFDLTLSGNLLFIYSQQLGLDFHLNAVRELMRVTRHEIRLYPLVTPEEQESPFLADVLRLAEAEGWSHEQLPSTYELMPGHNLLRLYRS
ncbi:SAM-dependent methyltransferase [Tumebacillus sp. ITR2]|uniref:SAM-dependent methyltransferase n=1 Tax=Tumebacillus amylolyticus TaxID=2801339 RepID=A0ABS1J8C6_9BACL|nr:SAM-dependent methyltransferase [Tumebacillus amylolyticus]MBL0386532.1 SAM-dependent methyltransferase [Tumebacillus amylolyticus]